MDAWSLVRNFRNSSSEIARALRTNASVKFAQRQTLMSTA